MSTNFDAKPSSSAKALGAGGEWIDRYVNEVGRRLPANQRGDVQREIRSLIEDEVAGQLEVNAEQGTGKPDAEATVLAVLQQFGAPQEIAAKYQAPRYLIGPAMFPIFQIVLGIVLAVTVFATMLGLVVAVGRGSAPSFENLMADLFGGVLQAFGSVTLVFVGLERLGVRASSNEAKVWDPRSLPPVKDDQRISVFETAVEIGFTAALLGLTVNYLTAGAGRVFVNGEWLPMPLFSQEFLQYVPWLIALWSVDIVVNIVLLARGRWEPAIRVAALVLAGATAFVFYQILVGPEIAAWAPLDPAFKITAAIIFAVSLWEAAKQGWMLLKGSAWGIGTAHSQHVA
jgi:hypothetical protein